MVETTSAVLPRVEHPVSSSLMYGLQSHHQPVNHSNQYRPIVAQASVQRPPKMVAPALPLDHDFVVQAAHPAHPEHHKWVETFGSTIASGSSSRRRRTESAGTSRSHSASQGPKNNRGDLASVVAALKTSTSPTPAQDETMDVSLLASPAFIAAKKSKGRTADGAKQQSVASPSTQGSSSNASSADEGTTSIGTSPYRPRRRASSSLISNAPSTSASLGVSPDQRKPRRRRRREDIKGKGQARYQAPTPPLPPPRISSSANFGGAPEENRDDRMDVVHGDHVVGARTTSLATGTRAQSTLHSAPGSTAPSPFLASPFQVYSPASGSSYRCPPASYNSARPSAPYAQSLPSQSRTRLVRAGDMSSYHSNAAAIDDAVQRPASSLDGHGSGTAEMSRARTVQQGTLTSHASPVVTFDTLVGEGKLHNARQANKDGGAQQDLDVARKHGLDDGKQHMQKSPRPTSVKSQGRSQRLKSILASVVLGSSTHQDTPLAEQFSLSRHPPPRATQPADKKVNQRAPVPASNQDSHVRRTTQSMDLPRGPLYTPQMRNESPPVPPLPQSVARKPVPTSLYDGLVADAMPTSVDPQHNPERLSLVGEEAEDRAEFHDAHDGGPLPTVSSETTTTFLPPDDRMKPSASLDPSSARAEGTPKPAALGSTSFMPESSTSSLVGGSSTASSSHQYEFPYTSGQGSSHSLKARSPLTCTPEMDVVALPQPQPIVRAEPLTPGRSKSRLPSLWSRSSSKLERDEVSSPLPVPQDQTQWSQGSSSFSHDQSVSSVVTHSQSVGSFDVGSSFLPDSDSQGTTGLGILALQTGDASLDSLRGDGGNASPLPHSASGGWRSRVPSLSSIKAARKARSMQLRDQANTPLPSPESLQKNKLPDSQSVSALGDGAQPDMDGIADSRDTEGVTDIANWPSSPYGCRLERQNSNNGQASLTDLSVLRTPNGRALKSRGIKEAVVAVGRKSFSRDRGKESALMTPEYRLPTIHKSLSPALLSERLTGEGQDRSSDLDHTTFSTEGEDADDGMDDDRVFPSSPGATRTKMSVAAQPRLDQITEQDATSTSSSQPSSIKSRTLPLPPNDAAEHASSPMRSQGSTASLLERRSRQGKATAAAPSLQLSPAEEVARTASMDRSRESPLSEFRSPSLAQSQSPSLSSLRSPSVEGLQTPRSARGLWRPGSAQGTSPLASSPARTSFSTDRDRAPVASPYVQHHLPSTSPRVGGFKGTLKKLASGAPLGARRGSFATAGAKGISSADLPDSGLTDSAAVIVRLPEAPEEVCEELKVDDRTDSPMQRQASRWNQAQPSSLGGSLRDPWDEGLAAAEKATQMLEVESNTLTASPGVSPLLSKTNGEGPPYRGFTETRVSIDAGSDPSSSCASLVDANASFLSVGAGRSVSGNSMPTGGLSTAVKDERRRHENSSAISSVSIAQDDAEVGDAGMRQNIRAQRTKSPGPGSHSDLDALELLLRRQKANEAEMLRNISERNRTPKLS